MRVSELVGLNDYDIDTLSGVVVVRGKGRKERLAPLGKPAIQAIESYQFHRDQIHGRGDNERGTFLSRNGKRLWDRDIRRRLDHYLGACGLSSKTSPTPYAIALPLISFKQAPTFGPFKNCLGIHH